MFVPVSASENVIIKPSMNSVITISTNIAMKILAFKNVCYGSEVQTFNIPQYNLKWSTNFDGSKGLILNIIYFKFTILIV